MVILKYYNEPKYEIVCLDNSFHIYVSLDYLRDYMTLINLATIAIIL